MPHPRKQAEARFRLLCSLGLHGQAVVPGLIRSLRDIVANSGCYLVRCNRDLEITNMYSEPQDPKLNALYYAEFHNRREKEVVLTIDERFAPSGLGETLA